MLSKVRINVPAYIFSKYVTIDVRGPMLVLWRLSLMSLETAGALEIAVLVAQVKVLLLRLLSLILQ